VAAAEGLVLRTYINGVVVQDTEGDDLLFSFAQLVADLSRFTTLAAGDVILSGTPAGASIARPGDLIEVEIVGGPQVSNPVMQSDVPIAAFGAQPRVDDAERQRAYGARPPVAAAGSGATVGTQLDPARRDELTAIGTATLSAQLRKLGVDHHSVAGLRSAADGARFAGTAQTLRYLPQREDRFERIGNGFNAQKRAVDRLAVGEVLVIDARGVPDAGTIGDLLVRTAMVRGAAGIVTDGGLRDVEATAALGLPVFYATPNPAVLGHRHVPVDTGLPIACGGALVEPGDVVVGDPDGVIVIPAHLLDAALAGARQQLLEEIYIQERIVAGDGLEGLYPLSATTRPGFEAWLARRPDPVSSDSKERT
jgi:regulator of RNase E activity RraA